MSNYVILENVADERGESAAKVARTLVRLGCDLYLRFGPSREPYIRENFFPEHPINFLVERYLRSQLD